MRFINRIFMLSTLALFLLISLTASAQWNKKPYTEWSETEAVKLLSDSAWAQTQVFSESSEAQTQIRRDSQGRIGDTGRSDDLGSSRTSDIPVLNFRIRFLSARPVRQAFSRLIELNQKGNLDEQAATRLKAFATSDSPDQIIVAVLVESPKTTNTFQEARALLYKQTTGELKNKTYLLVKGGERVYLQEYQPPASDGLGARFIFPRTLSGKPIISAENESVRFYSELSSAYTLNRSYKIKDMMFDGKLEY